MNPFCLFQRPAGNYGATRSPVGSMVQSSATERAIPAMTWTPEHPAVRHGSPVQSYRWRREQSHLPHTLPVQPRPGAPDSSPPVPQNAEADSADFRGHPCSKCGKVYSSSGGLSVHMQFHTGRFSYWCEKCQKGFTCKGNYDYHMAKHEGRDFPCDRCQKRFQSKQTLQKHVNKEHINK